MNSIKQFIFLYPISEILDYEIKNHSYHEDNKSYRDKYSYLLNRCIDVRYRKNGYVINYALFNGSPISEIIELIKKTQGDGSLFKVKLTNILFTFHGEFIDKFILSLLYSQTLFMLQKYFRNYFSCFDFVN